MLALAIVLIPHYTNEVFIVLTNIQWIVSILLIVVLMKEEPNHQYGNVRIQFTLDIIIIVLCGLTGPFVIFMLPFFVWKWYRDKGKYNCITMLLVITVSAVQLSFILFATHHSQNNDLVFNLTSYSKIIGYKIFGSLFIGINSVYNIDHFLLSIIYFIFIFACLKFSSQNKRFVVFSLGIHFIIIFATLYKFKANPEILVPAENGLRYFYIPHIMLTWSIIALVRKEEKWKNFIIAIALALILVSSFKSGFHRDEYIDYNWRSYSKSIGKEDVIIPINPEGWQIYVKAPK